MALRHSRRCVRSNLMRIEKEPASSYEGDCARQILLTLLTKTGLTKIGTAPPEVILGHRNWISFTLPTEVSIADILNIRNQAGQRIFVRDFWRPSAGARSRTSPSLHLTSIGRGSEIRGHVDAYYWATHPIRHASEFLSKKTVAPSAIWRRMSASLNTSVSVGNPVFSR